ncbi:MAG: hypothetical protein AB7S38_17900 [Vulcanimicrobiota bacterium]
MKKYAVTLLICGLAASSAWAEQTKTDCIDDGLHLQGAVVGNQSDGLLIQDGSNFQFVPNMEAYKLDLKPLHATRLSELQLQVNNNLGMGAGYSSPYLWEVGRGPGFQGYSTWNGPAVPYSPIAPYYRR